MDNTFKNRLKKLRNEYGLLQKEVAAKIGIARTTYGSYETGFREPDIDTLKKIANLFECTIDYLLGYSNKKEISKSSDYEIIIDEAKKNNISVEELKEILDLIYKLRKNTN